MERKDRPAARVLLVDGRDRLLLFRGGDPADPELRYWFTPGGGLDPGEASAAGAARELYEETGLRLDPAELGEPVHEETAYFTFDRVPYRQHQQFYLVRVPGWQVDTAGFDPIEAGSIDAHRWWTVAELERTDELFYPRDLVEILKRLGMSSC